MITGIYLVFPGRKTDQQIVTELENHRKHSIVPSLSFYILDYMRIKTLAKEIELSFLASVVNIYPHHSLKLVVFKDNELAFFPYKVKRKYTLVYSFNHVRLLTSDKADSFFIIRYHLKFYFENVRTNVFYSDISSENRALGFRLLNLHDACHTSILRLIIFLWSAKRLTFFLNADEIVEDVGAINLDNCIGNESIHVHITDKDL